MDVKEKAKDDAGIKEEGKKSFIYIVMCRDGSLYTGITKNLDQRMRDHYYKTEKGAKYTKSRGVQRIMMVWETDSYRSAARLEYAIKRLTHGQKLELIREPGEKVKTLFPKLAEETYVPRREYAKEIIQFLRET